MKDLWARVTRKPQQQHDSKKPVSRSNDETVFRFIFGDVVFTILPLILVALIRLATGKTLPSLIELLPELSFEAIVFFGLAISQIIDLKIRVQDDKSYRTENLVRFCVVFLIISVLVLALTSLGNDIVSLDQTLLAIVQVLVLSLAGWLLYQVHATKNDIETKRKTLPESLSQEYYHLFLRQALREAEDQLEYAVVAFQRHDALRLGPEDGESPTELSMDRLSSNKDMEAIIKKLEVTIRQVRDEHSRIAKALKKNSG